MEGQFPKTKGPRRVRPFCFWECLSSPLGLYHCKSRGECHHKPKHRKMVRCRRMRDICTYSPILKRHFLEHFHCSSICCGPPLAKILDEVPSQIQWIHSKIAMTLEAMHFLHGPPSKIIFIDCCLCV